MFHSERKAFTIHYLDTDLWIGVKTDIDMNPIRSFIQERISGVRKILDNYITEYPEFKDSLIPLNSSITSWHEVIKQMLNASLKAGIGPMGAVAGAIAEWIGKEVQSEFHLLDIIVENGGDVYIHSNEEVNISVFSGESPLTDKIGIRIPKEYMPIGVCTSSATVGHSLSFGKADAVMIAAKNTALADAFATAYCNMVQTPQDIENVISLINANEEIVSAIIVMDDKFGITGKFELQLFEK